MHTSLQTHKALDLFTILPIDYVKVNKKTWCLAQTHIFSMPEIYLSDI